MDDTIQSISSRICQEGEASWKWNLFEFVDAFRLQPSATLVQPAPDNELTDHMRALLASCVETLCDERGIASPSWCRETAALAHPWFVSGVENLKASALVESPVHFRKRNIFVLGNFLDRV